MFQFVRGVEVVDGGDGTPREQGRQHGDEKFQVVLAAQGYHRALGAVSQAEGFCERARFFQKGSVGYGLAGERVFLQKDHPVCEKIAFWNRFIFFYYFNVSF